MLHAVLMNILQTAHSVQHRVVVKYCVRILALRSGGSEDRIPMGTRFSALACVAYPASYKMGTVSLPRR